MMIQLIEMPHTYQSLLSIQIIRINVNFSDSNLYLSFTESQEAVMVIIKEKETGKILGKEYYVEISDITLDTKFPKGKTT